MISNLKKVFIPEYFLERYHRHSAIFWLFIVFVLCETIVNPIGEFPLNDDWAYTKALNSFRLEHQINIGTWPAMTLLTQILWGFGFTSVFGFSFFILRFSTLVSSFIGLTFVYKIIHNLSENKTVSFLGTSVLLFNPLYFNLSNTFMTDVNFNTLLILGLYYCFDYFRYQKRSSLVVIFVASILIVLLRQYGIILPFCFLISCLFVKAQKPKVILSALLILALAYITLKYYESYLKNVLPAEASYRFSGSSNPTLRVFWDQFLENLGGRYKTIIYTILFYLSPIALLLFPFVKSGFRSVLLILVATSCVIFSYFLFRDSSVQILNVFTGMSLGTETFVDELRNASVDSIHNHPETFKRVFPWICILLSSVTLTFIVVVAVTFRINQNLRSIAPERILISSLLISYLFFIILTDSYFDRYHIPFVTLGIVLVFHFLSPISDTKISLSFPIILLLFVYISVFGTKDYFARTRKTWEAYRELRKNPSTKASLINAGFEIYFWNEGKGDPALWDFFDKNKFEYVLEYDAPEGFRPSKTYRFQRYCPYTEDSLRVFERQK